MFAGEDVRLSILHFIDWTDSHMAPAVLKTPSMSRLQMQAVVKRCQGLQSNTTQMPKVTRQNKKCSSCVNLEAKLTHERKEHVSQIERERDVFKVKSM